VTAKDISAPRVVGSCNNFNMYLGLTLSSHDMPPLALSAASYRFRLKVYLSVSYQSMYHALTFRPFSIGSSLVDEPLVIPSM